MQGGPCSGAVCGDAGKAGRRAAKRWGAHFCAPHRSYIFGVIASYL